MSNDPVDGGTVTQQIEGQIVAVDFEAQTITLSFAEDARVPLTGDATVTFATVPEQEKERAEEQLDTLLNAIGNPADLRLLAGGVGVNTPGTRRHWGRIADAVESLAAAGGGGRRGGRNR